MRKKYVYILFCILATVTLLTPVVSSINIEIKKDSKIYCEPVGYPPNNPPDKPTITGPSKANVGDEVTFVVTTFDHEYDQVYFMFNFWDGSDDAITDWIGPFAYDAELSYTHVYEEEGSYQVSVKAKDDPNLDGDHSDGLESLQASTAITIPKSKTKAIIEKVDVEQSEVVDYLADSYVCSDWRHVYIRHTEQVTNNGNTPVELTTYFSMPPERPHQWVEGGGKYGDIIFTPGGFTTVQLNGADSDVAYDTTSLTHGTVYISMEFWAKLATIEYLIDPDWVSSFVPQDIADQYLKLEGSKYAFDSWIVQLNAGLAGLGETNQYRKARNIFNYTGDRLTYQTNGGAWDDAATVLQRGNGTCSEYCFVFIALCRLNGIPARYMGGIHTSDHSNGFVDYAGHRWCEIYLNPYGWIPVDPTWGDGNRNAYFGRRDNRCFGTTVAAGPLPGLSWRYSSNTGWTPSNPDMGRMDYSTWIWDIRSKSKTKNTNENNDNQFEMDISDLEDYRNYEPGLLDLDTDNNKKPKTFEDILIKLVYRFPRLLNVIQNLLKQ